MEQLALDFLPLVSMLSLSPSFFQLFNFRGHETKGEDKAIGGLGSFYWRITKPSTIQCEITGDHTSAAERIPVRLGFSGFIEWEFSQTLRGMDHVVPQGIFFLVNEVYLNNRCEREKHSIVACATMKLLNKHSILLSSNVFRRSVDRAFQGNCIPCLEPVKPKILPKLRARSWSSPVFQNKIPAAWRSDLRWSFQMRVFSSLSRVLRGIRVTASEGFLETLSFNLNPRTSLKITDV